MVCGSLCKGDQSSENVDEEDENLNGLFLSVDGQPSLKCAAENSIQNNPLEISGGQQGFKSRSTLIHKMIDVGLLLANASQLKVLLTSEQGQFSQVNLALVILSMVFQIAFILNMIGIWFFEPEPEEYNSEGQSNKTKTEGQNSNTNGAGTNKDALKRKLKWLDVIGYVLVAFVIIFNILILGFGLNGDIKASSVNVCKTKNIGIVNGTLTTLN